MHILRSVISDMFRVKMDPPLVTIYFLGGLSYYNLYVSGFFSINATIFNRVFLIVNFVFQVRCIIRNIVRDWAAEVLLNSFKTSDSIFIVIHDL